MFRRGVEPIVSPWSSSSTDTMLAAFRQRANQRPRQKSFTRINRLEWALVRSRLNRTRCKMWHEKHERRLDCAWGFPETWSIVPRFVRKDLDKSHSWQLNEMEWELARPRLKCCGSFSGYGCCGGFKEDRGVYAVSPFALFTPQAMTKGAVIRSSLLSLHLMIGMGYVQWSNTGRRIFHVPLS
jgi:hypothetical protein